ncbi:shugoshin 2-like [Labrus mixtus]|uniref:shugoshin 2-like n=1 Tax=Labrus mixtus TaxID=508554 RepID=UPI0029C0DA30|nr:shugoshin 2-like [Labrus mixtus]
MGTSRPTVQNRGADGVYTSSFFKVSLKKNNKALAVALEMQKERSRQLEKDIMFLQKQVEALCFELAAKKYKHRKLLLILKNLHSNTRQHLDMVADLFSDGVRRISTQTLSLFVCYLEIDIKGTIVLERRTVLSQ